MAIVDVILGDWRLWIWGVIVLFALLRVLIRRTSLHRAARNKKNPAEIEALLSAGADSNARVYWNFPFKGQNLRLAYGRIVLYNPYTQVGKWPTV